MTSRLRSAAPLAGLAALALVVTACSTPSADAAPADAAETVVVDNAQPTLVLVEEDGESSYREDPSTERAAVEVPREPEAVITFDIATLDTLDAIGAGDAVVAIPDVVLPDYLSDYADLPKVGTLFEPDFEAVAELGPDLIVTAARSTGQYDELSEIATTIDLTGTPGGTFDPAAGLVRAAQLGEIFGREDEVAELAGQIEERIDALAAAASGSALVLAVSGGEYSAFGEGSRFGWFFDELGFTPAVPAAELPGAEGSPHGDSVTNEFLLTADPEWIFAFDRGAATGDGGSAEETLANELVERTAAAQNDRIVLLPAGELYIVINGLTAISAVLDTVEEAVAS
ncbi:iron ABC transporter substrate-binding protein [Microbacterium sp. dk485]|uniref:siderophore ABC transporter substrate-binding protein n=1 Tax=Microbacterium TaxID=33882 RepID=UPI0010740F33|nr:MULTISPECIES: ABC transporter substrate-binding protein [Microbacterium]TFV82417.1 iron ABC transporter substrate-binding protein [Microbacterium sp. dk485]TXK20255.1 ABC transporter substrate-binding protein [Microbacterium wangchenii]